MQAYDVFMVIVLVAAVVWGFWKGLAWQLASLASMVLSYFVALNFRTPLASLIKASPPWNIFLSMLILFLGTSLVVWVGFNLVSEAMERVKLKEFDRQVGAVFGFAKGVLLCVIITLFAVTLLPEDQQKSICTSKSGYYIAVLLDKASAILPAEYHDVIEPYVANLDRNVQQNSSSFLNLGTKKPIRAVPAEGFTFPGFDGNSTNKQPAAPVLPSFPSFAIPGQGTSDPQTADRVPPTFSPPPADDFRR